MIVAKLVDEAWSKADPAALAAAGAAGVVGYVSEDQTGKNISREQVDQLHALHLDVGLVYEYDPQAALGGYARGTRDAGVAVAHAQALGAPRGTCLYAAVDFPATAEQLPTVMDYAAAFYVVAKMAGYRAGVYGSYDVIQYLAQHGYTGLLWQTYAWSAAHWSAAAVLWQTANDVHVGAAAVDLDEAHALDWGQWTWRNGMELTDTITGTDLPGRTIGQVLTDLENFRNWLVSTPGSQDQYTTPAPGSPAALLAQALKAGGTQTLTDADVDRIAHRVLQLLGASITNG